MPNWHVGQKVICVRKEPLKSALPNHPYAKLWDGPGSTEEPKNGEIYTIARIWHYEGIDWVSFWLEGFTDNMIAFHEELFKPLSETSIKTEEKANAK